MLYVTGLLEAKVDASERRTAELLAETDAKVEGLQATIENVREDLVRSSQGISELVGQRLAEQRATQAAPFAALRGACSFADVVAALHRARELDLIPEFGVRVPLDNTGWYVHFPTPLEPEAAFLDVRIETGSLRVFVAHRWDPSYSPADLFVHVAEVLQQRRSWDGDQMYEPGQTFAHLADLLEAAFDAQRQGGRRRCGSSKHSRHLITKTTQLGAAGLHGSSPTTG
ncbi:hypothetical protein DKT68_13460 [Micromonospora acroterricola]|uniref:Uncharacterized protein n=1 Tax=Micromonospora acroterricola TaxID=2202421 RepID=A0A317D886_9ACTN|nr:hypothetical protein [Micromonospora acroterricola]PWR08993.1 hypothetical protein DKT68_13460 [Micromonospora acroterricola]